MARPVGGVLAEEGAQRLAVTEVGQPRDGPARLRAVGDLALEVDPEVARAVGHISSRIERHAGPGQARAGLGDGGLAHRRRQRQAAAVVAAAARLGAGSSSCARRNPIRHPSVSR